MGVFQSIWIIWGYNWLPFGIHHFESGLVMEICVSGCADVKSSVESFRLGFISFGIWNLSYFVIFVY